MPTKTKIVRMSRSKRVPRSLNIKNVKYQFKRKSKGATEDLQKYKQNLDAQLKVLEDKRKANIAEIEMANIQKTTIYLTLLQLLLKGTQKSEQMAKYYAKKAKIDFSMLSRDSKNPKMARKVGSMRISAPRKPSYSSKRILSKKIKNKIISNRKYYEEGAHLGDAEIGLGLRLK